MNKTYKYDMHCHIREGSSDSLVNGKECIETLINKGFKGLAITDHNSFKGYEYINNNLKGNYSDFYILKGIECDTVNAGHFLVFMPDDFDGKLLIHRGSKLKKLIQYVHSNGGILGPAHPFSEPYLAIFNSNHYKETDDIYKEFDFIETLNGGEKKQENQKALEYAKKHNLVVFGGSDSHYLNDCGYAYTLFDEEIKTNNELIAYIKKHKNTVVGGEEYINKDRINCDRFGRIPYLYRHLENLYFSLVNKLK